MNATKVHSHQNIVKTTVMGSQCCKKRQDIFYNNSAHEDSSLLPRNTGSSSNPKRLVEPDYESIIILQNTRNHSPSVTASDPGRLESSKTLL